MDSTLFTIGTALSRARGHGLPVRLLVSGHWLSGHVADIDSQGVVLAGDDEQHVVRVQDISAVTVPRHVESSRHHGTEQDSQADTGGSATNPPMATVRVLQAAQS